MIIRFCKRAALYSLAVALFLILWIPAAQAQKLPVGPMGLFQPPQPRIRVPRSIRAALPKQALIKMVHDSELVPGDAFVLYERDDMFSPDPVLVILRNRHVLQRWHLPALLDGDRDYVFVAGARFRLLPQKEALAVAFRNIGDGSGTLLFMIALEHAKYRVVLKQSTAQGRLEANDNGEVRVWSAAYDGKCVWCDHSYDITKYEWSGSALIAAGKKNTKRALDPAVIGVRPIIVAQRPIKVV